MKKPIFNIRVYGLFFREDGHLLLTDENRMGMRFTKFPGGGLEFGEGTRECLKREFQEEMNLEIEILDHFYTTDFFVPSAFDPTQQVMSIYYKVSGLWPANLPLSEKRFGFVTGEEGEMLYRFMPLDRIAEEELNFPIDKHVLQLLKHQLL